ncbi:MAG: gliding motility protein GldN [Bacteroidota bacterium]|nr:gliding motility protein GldN [Bacteroidota bacterium]
MKKIANFILICLTVIQANAQVPPVGLYDPNTIKQRGLIYWPHLCEADVMYCWRVECMIDVREKMNILMNWPKNPLSHILQNAMNEGYLTPYYSDSLDRAEEAAEVEKITSDTKIIFVPDDPFDPFGPGHDSLIFIKFDWEGGIKRYKILEDWIFDKKESRFFSRIIYIAPLFVKTVNGIPTAEIPICYFKYHDNTGRDSMCFRNVAVNQEVFNRNNDAARLSYDDFFELRMFSSWIYKESNPFDMRINQFEEFKSSPVNALIESDNIKKKLFEYEHNLWEF